MTQQKLKPAEKKFSEPSSKMKKTEIGLIPEDWDVAKVGDNIEVQGGYAFKSLDYKDSGIKLIRITNVTHGKIDLKELVYLPLHYQNQYSDFDLKENDILIVLTRPIIGGGLKAGTIKGNHLPALLNQRVGRLIIKNAKVHSSFLAHFIHSNYFVNEINKRLTTMNQPNISTSDIDSILIPLPQLNEQKKISEVLSTIDKRLDILERESQRVERLKVGLMKELFEKKRWPAVTLGDEKFFEMIMGQSPPSELYNRDGVGLPFLQGNAEFGDLHPSPTIYCSKPLKMAKKGDILISVRAPVGEVNMADTDCCIGRGVGAIRAKEGVDSQFLFFYLKSVNSKLDSISGGSTFKAITKNQLEKLEVFLPPLNEQRKISLILSTIDKKLSIQKSKKSKLESIKKSLMNDLLTGKKRVKVTQ